uniref:Uncharacterized protein n=1 Tax=Cyanoderma ruficeps TaxID=181631 RepID=A0A8C3XHS2_9PASS
MGLLRAPNEGKLFPGAFVISVAPLPAQTSFARREPAGSSFTGSHIHTCSRSTMPHHGVLTAVPHCHSFCQGLIPHHQERDGSRARSAGIKLGSFREALGKNNTEILCKAATIAREGQSCHRDLEGVYLNLLGLVWRRAEQKRPCPVAAGSTTSLKNFLKELHQLQRLQTMENLVPLA